METLRYYFLTVFFSFLITGLLSAQPKLEKDYSFVMEVPSVISMESSPAHVYVLSDSEGMVVFRTRQDTLQWLYSSTGMQQRGNTVTADIRFAYLYGSDSRLTVLEPTSVLGVYSSTPLPDKPLDAERIDEHLYVALGSEGLGQLSLRTPSSVDSTINMIARSQLQNERIIDLEASSNQLFALSGDQKLFIFKLSDGAMALSKELPLLRELDHISLSENTLYGSDKEGSIYEVDNSGELSKLGSIDEPIKKIRSWNDWLLIQGSSNRIWTSYQNRAPVLWKDDSRAGNYFAVAQDQLWLSEYNRISRIVTTYQSEESSVSQRSEVSGNFELKPIENQIIPFPKPLLLSLDLESEFPIDQVQFAYQSDIQSAKIKGNGFYWQPKAEDVGQHRLKLIATASNGQTDSTDFLIEVRSFNAPPRFSPLRPVTIPVQQPFTLPLKALDPDGMNQGLVRYLGVDLPEGATVDEQSGKFNWTPTARQVGENKFRVIATDQYGAASSVDVTIRVIETAQRAEDGD